MSNVLKRVLARDVQPAIGCTEPVAVALACSVAAQAVSGVDLSIDKIEKVSVIVDQGVMKNGMGVVVPNSNGTKGCVMAAALGAATKTLNYDMTILQGVSFSSLAVANRLVDQGCVELICDESKTSLYIHAIVTVAGKVGEAVIEESHTNFTYVTDSHFPLGLYNLASGQNDCAGDNLDAILKDLSIAELIDLASNMDEEDQQFALSGAKMNLALAEVGMNMSGIGSALSTMIKNGGLPDHPFNYTKIMTACATDARMNGASLPAMSSGGSGNQGIVAILAPYLMGQSKGIDPQIVAQSIGLSHLINSQIKCHTGHLSAMCGCAVAAGAGAAAGLVYQIDPSPVVIGAAINNLLANLTGTLCDGAKSSCALKVIGAVEAAVISANLALQGFTLSHGDGIVHTNASQTIANVGEICSSADSIINRSVVNIMCRQVVLT